MKHVSRVIDRSGAYTLCWENLWERTNLKGFPVGIKISLKMHKNIVINKSCTFIFFSEVLAEITSKA